MATENIRKVTSALNVDLYTHVVDNKGHDGIKLAFMKADVQEFDTDTDLAFVQVLRTAAARNKVEYILEGHSFIEEGVSPANNNYFDGGLHRGYRASLRQDSDSHLSPDDLLAVPQVGAHIPTALHPPPLVAQVLQTGGAA